MHFDYDEHELVSVIIPAYNAERFLPATLRSAQFQTYPNLEILIVDDGSTDGTTGLADAAASADRRIRVLRRSNAGVAAARNAGIEVARGRFIAPLDADDLWHPEKIARQVEVMRRGGARVGLVYAWSSIIDEDDRVIHQAAVADSFRGPVYPHLAHSNFLSNSSVPLIRRECLLHVGGYDVDLRRRGAEGCEDIQLYLAIAERWDFDLVPQYLIGYRQTTASMSQNIWRMRRSHLLVLERARSRHPELPGCVLRWSEADLSFWLAGKCRRSGNWRAMAALVLLAFWRDPVFPVRKAARRLAMRTLGDLMERLSGGEREAMTAAPRHFLSLAPEPAVGDFERFRKETGWIDRRRHRFVATLAVDVPREEAERVTVGTKCLSLPE
ncbi:glycosyltransferase involved in cell wall biosynthesis [Skermanella aerolata]|uniref:glycosyltransferase family 2 protein n=1 Tax=Skermanella aerolata TaxID=393310 RepID=UPI003D1B412F